MNRRNWIVSISQEDADADKVYGPYVSRRAHEIAKQFNERINAEEAGWVYATAYPIESLDISAILAEYGQEGAA